MKNLTQELENAVILKDLMRSIREDIELDKTYAKVIGLLANKVLESLKEEPTLEVKVPEALINEIQKGIQRELKRSCI